MSITKEKKSSLIKEFAKSNNDTGSVAVQCAALTEQINNLTSHAQQNPKDFQSRRGLLAMVNKRKRLLAYYKRVNESAHQDLIAKLGLRK